MEKITISKKEYENLKELVKSARNLNELFLPKVNYGASSLDATAIAALNDFSRKIRKAEENDK